MARQRAAEWLPWPPRLAHRPAHLHVPGPGSQRALTILPLLCPALEQGPGAPLCRCGVRGPAPSPMCLVAVLYQLILGAQKCGMLAL